jgi:hypothetical protein
MFTEHIPGIPGTAFYMRPYGSKRANYILENSHFYLGFSKRGVGPELDIQFKAECLYEYDPSVLSEMVDRLVRYFIGPELSYKAKVRRADVAVDFQQQGFELPEIRDVVSRARRWGYHGEGRTPTTLTLGRADQALQAQIYCKSLELDQSDKYWMYDVWRASGVYEETLAVWRAELRFFREGLRAFEINSLDELLRELGDLCSYAVGSGPGSWLRICDADSRDLRSARRETAGWWTTLCAAFISGEVVRGRKRKGYDPRPSFTRCVELAGAHMARAAALARFGGWSLAHNPGSFGRKVGEIYADILKDKGGTWADKVNDRTASMRSRAWLTRSPDPAASWGF